MNHTTRIALISCLIIAMTPVLSLAQKAPAAPVMVESAQRDTFSATLWVSGTVISQNDARIAAETDGRVTWVANVGARIKKGEAIARIDAQNLHLNLSDSEAQLASLKAQFKFRDSSLQRFQKLSASNNAAATQLDEAQSQLDITRQDIKRAEVAIAQIKRRIAQTEVLAPFPGVVAERLVQIGEFVARGSQVARLVDTEHREIRAQAPLSIASWIREGMQVSVKHNKRESLSMINYVIPVGDERSRMLEIRIAAEDPAWIVGSPVRIALPNSEPRELVAIPRDGLVLRGSNIFVMRVNDDNTVEKVSVETGIGLGGLVEVIGNIDHGDLIITRGGERLQPGQIVKLEPFGAPG
ncbi:MAG: efflux RND transporter periplasmic adaptor subunit [Xanthomonadales bacterium]|nr:efflux RND transporter periplasmic adaptor subunit [Xanthomonadales bacterium]